MIHSYTSISTFGNCPAQFYARYIQKIPVPETPEMRAGTEAHKALENRLLHDYPLPPHLVQCEPICASIDKKRTAQLEVRMAVTRDLKDTTFFDAGGYLRGVLDILMCNTDFTTAFIGDWKTGKNREAQSEPLQLMIFAAFVFSYYDTVQTVTATNIYTRTGQMGAVNKWQRSELSSLWRHIIPLIDEIEQAERDGKWPETPSGLCGWCPVVACRHNRARG